MNSVQAKNGSYSEFMNKPIEEDDRMDLEAILQIIENSPTSTPQQPETPLSARANQSPPSVNEEDEENQRITERALEILCPMQ